MSSIVIVRRHLPYEAWYLVHFATYAGIALAWFHQIPTGNELVLDRLAAGYWKGLYVATLALVLVFRVGAPTVAAFRHRLRVAEVVDEGAGAVSLRLTGRRLDRLGARAGQFFLWRFLDRKRWWASHPLSLSAAPDGRSLRITVKALGGFSAGIRDVRVGTRVAAEGPFGVFTERSRQRDTVLLVGGGIGIAPVRALVEDAAGDVVVVNRALTRDELVLGDELAEVARRRGIPIHDVIGDHATPEGAELLSAGHLRQLVPDIAERDVFVCGPKGMTDAIVRSARRAGVPRHHIHVERFAL